MKPGSSLAKMAATLGSVAKLCAAIAALSWPVAVRATNAPISWSAVSAETGAASDILTTGRLVAAVTFGTPETVNGVGFTAGSSDIIISGEAGLLSPVSAFAAFSYDPSLFRGWAPGYAALLSGAAYGHGSATGGSAMMLTLSGLTAGQSYLVQLLEAPWDANWTTSFSDGTTSSAALMVFGSSTAAPTISAVTDYVTGVFTASSASQTIYAHGPYADTLLGAVQFRAVPQPVGEPPSAVVLGVALAGIGCWRRRKS